MKHRFSLIAVSIALGALDTVQAAELVYTPVNPNFGGNPNNGLVLQQQATMNNRHKEPKAPQKTATQAIADSITNSVMSKIANDVATAITDGDPSGTFQVGGSTISFINNGTYTTLTINDGRGGITTLDIPNGI